ncbi:hypothetical protein HDU96_001483, partial [Phlyctochytrium bullatum]
HCIGHRIGIGNARAPHDPRRPRRLPLRKKPAAAASRGLDHRSFTAPIFPIAAAYILNNVRNEELYPVGEFKVGPQGPHGAFVSEGSTLTPFTQLAQAPRPQSRPTHFTLEPIPVAFTATASSPPLPTTTTPNPAPISSSGVVSPAIYVLMVVGPLLCVLCIFAACRLAGRLGCIARIAQGRRKVEVTAVPLCAKASAAKRAIDTEKALLCTTTGPAKEPPQDTVALTATIAVPTPPPTRGRSRYRANDAHAPTTEPDVPIDEVDGAPYGPRSDTSTPRIAAPRLSRRGSLTSIASTTAGEDRLRRRRGSSASGASDDVPWCVAGPAVGRRPPSPVRRGSAGSDSIAAAAVAAAWEEQWVLGPPLPPPIAPSHGCLAAECEVEVARDQDALPATSAVAETAVPTPQPPTPPTPRTSPRGLGWLTLTRVADEEKGGVVVVEVGEDSGGLVRDVMVERRRRRWKWWWAKRDGSDAAAVPVRSFAAVYTEDPPSFEEAVGGMA